MYNWIVGELCTKTCGKQNPQNFGEIECSNGSPKSFYNKNNGCIIGCSENFAQKQNPQNFEEIECSNGSPKSSWNRFWMGPSAPVAESGWCISAPSAHRAEGFLFILKYPLFFKITFTCIQKIDLLRLLSFFNKLLFTIWSKILKVAKVPNLWRANLCLLLILLFLFLLLLWNILHLLLKCLALLVKSFFLMALFYFAIFATNSKAAANPLTSFLSALLFLLDFANGKLSILPKIVTFFSFMIHFKLTLYLNASLYLPYLTTLLTTLYLKITLTIFLKNTINHLLLTFPILLLILFPYLIFNSLTIHSHS